MKIVVFGASGGVGQEVVRQALEANHEVRAFVRNPDKISIQHPHLTLIQGDGLDNNAVSHAIQGQDAVVCCVGNRGMGKTTLMSDITRNLVQGMEQNGVTRIAYVGSAGIHKELQGIIGSIVGFMLRNPLADHRRSYEHLQNSSLQWTIARPMQLTNEARTGIYRESETGIASRGQKISRADVAHFLLKSLTEDSYINQSIGLVY
ncbi:putative NADH-flavin reductase [Paenibacillus sp. DS2015]|uniref:NAD(P)-dependent oxidoreductase n=1 Tax=Paenibacillus sp. DS2015 TaxID=3373917 RepID=UPI003D1F3A53